MNCNGTSVVPKGETRKADQHIGGLLMVLPIVSLAQTVTGRVSTTATSTFDHAQRGWGGGGGGGGGGVGGGGWGAGGGGGRLFGAPCLTIPNGSSRGTVAAGT